MALIEIPDPVPVYDNDTLDWTLTITQPAEDPENDPEPFDLSGVTSARMHLRAEACAPDVHLDISTANSRLLLTDPENGGIALNVDPILLRPLAKRIYETDIVFVFGETERRCAIGRIDLKCGATR